MNKIQTITEPVVGEGATLCYPQDTYGYVITRVSPSGKTFWMVPLALVDKTTGHEPDHYEGPFPVWSHTYTEQEREEMRLDTKEIVVRKVKRGWSRNGTPVALGSARYHRNYSY